MNLMCIILTFPLNSDCLLYGIILLYVIHLYNKLLQFDQVRQDGLFQAYLFATWNQSSGNFKE